MTIQVCREKAPGIVRISCAVTLWLALMASVSLFNLSESIDYLTGTLWFCCGTILSRLLLFRTLVLLARKILIALTGVNAASIAAVVTISSWSCGSRRC